MATDHIARLPPCLLGQGYRFGPPVPEDEAAALLSQVEGPDAGAGRRNGSA
jgi:hypothetical protein